MKVAAAQMVSGADISANLTRVCDLVRTAQVKNADLVVFPEMFLTFAHKGGVTVETQRELLSRLGALAKAHQIWIIAGSIPIHCGVIFDGEKETATKPHAVTVVFNSDGEIQGHYAKMHLFDVDVDDNTRTYRESDRYAQGRNIPHFQAPFADFGVAICYDLRFPEFFVRLSQTNSKVIFIPAAFTEKTGEAHWEVLLRARAIETQCYIVAANQGGVHSNGLRTWGHSMVVNPWGEIVSKAGKGEALLVTDLSLQALDEIRKNMPIRQHRCIDSW